jgi:hypothetical protein
MAAKPKEADVEEDEKPEEENEQATSKSKFKFIPKFKLPPLKWMIIGGAGVLVLVGGGGGAYYFLKGRGKTGDICRPARRPGEPFEFRRRPNAIPQGQDRS